MRILQIVFLLSVCGCSQARNLTISNILEIAKLSKDVTIDLLKTFKLLDEYVGQTSKASCQRVLFDEIKILKKKIDMFSAQMGTIPTIKPDMHIVHAMVLYISKQPELALKLMKVYEKIDSIEIKYQHMGNFIEDLTLESMEDLARTFVRVLHSFSIQSELDGMHAIIAPSEDGVPSVFEDLIEIMKVQGNKMFCGLQMSEQQLLLNLYNTLALTELKGFLMIELYYMLLKLDNQGNFTFEAAQEWYKDRSATTLKLAIEAVKLVSIEIWKCDPNKQVKNKTYIEITELLQGHIENVKNLNKLRSCQPKCDSFTNTISYDFKGQEMFSNKNKHCRGHLINCRPIADATVCFADAGTNRRYEYIDHAGKVIGRWKDCSHSSASFKAWLRWFVYCDYCMCFCEEQGVNSDRFFSMRSSESDIDHNKVVTGLRFVKKNRIIHLQIQQGKLLPNAQIDLTTVRWKPVEDYKIDDRKVFNGQDYHTLTWEKRNFDLDDLVTKEEELVTGVRFGLIGSHLNFQIRLTPFNFTTGTLEVGTSKWKHNEVSEKNRKKVNLDHKDIPIRSLNHSLPVSKSRMYLEFTHTDLCMDVAQTTVPFIDAQAVASGKPVPLSGAGVMYKGSKNFGGFIGPKIMTYDYSKLLLNADDDTNDIYLQ